MIKALKIFLTNINPFNVLADIQAGEKLNTEIERFFSFETSPRKTEGYDFNKILNSLSIFYNCQIHVFTSQGQNIKEASFPLQFDPSKEQIFLHMVRLPENFHLEVICDFDIFQQAVKRYYCLYCDSSVSSPPNKYRHTCATGRYCLCCKRKHLSDYTWYFPRNKKNTVIVEKVKIMVPVLNVICHLKAMIVKKIIESLNARGTLSADNVIK